MYYKRTLIMSDIDDRTSSKKGVLTLENFDGKTKGQLRVYNLKDKPKALALGISCGAEVTKVPINDFDNILDFDCPKNINLQEKLSCALVDIENINSPKIIIGGSSNYLNDWADRVEQSFICDAKIIEREEMYESDLPEIEKEINNVLLEDKEYKDCSMCSHCKYKEAFFAKEKQEKSSNLDKINEILSVATPCDEQNLKIEPVHNLEQDIKVETTEDTSFDKKTVEEDNKDKTKEKFDDIDSDSQKNEQNQEEKELPKEDKIDKDTEFYEQIKDQIDELFKNHNREENLEMLIPNSKWVKVEYQDVPGHYVMGLVYDEDKLRFISYGLPSGNSKTPPEDLADYAQWIETNNNSGSGYWLVYQSAKDGESVKVV